MLTAEVAEVQPRNLTWKFELARAVRLAKLEVFGIEDVLNEAQAKVGIALLKAFGDHPGGFLYFEPCTARNSERPPDAVLCHPQTGVLVFEVKGYPISLIERISGGSFQVRHRGVSRTENPFHQVRRAMFEIRHAVERALQPGDEIPLLEYFVALPHISGSDWMTKGYEQCVEMERVLLAEDLDGASLRKRLTDFVGDAKRGKHLKHPLTARQMEVVRMAFGDSAVIVQERTARRGISDETLGAYLDDAANAEKYLSLEQQELSRLEVRGHPRVIRGVAGSGKTVVLANMAARYVKRFMAQQGTLFGDGPRPPRVAVVCFNRALVPLIREKIQDAYKSQTMEAIPGNAVKVSHLNGLIYGLTKEGLPVSYLRIGGEDGIDSVAARAAEYRRQLEYLKKSNPKRLDPFLFDAIFVDEGQDFEEEEFRLLMDLIRPDPQTREKALIIFYDDAQNVYGRNRPVWKNVDIDVQRGDRSRVMKECFRNTRQIVELAFNVLVGTCAPPSARVETRTFADLETLRSRELDGSPLIEEREDVIRANFARGSGEWPEVHTFRSRTEETKWLVAQLRRLIVDELVRPEDILVLFHQSVEFSDLKDQLRHEIPSEHLRGIIRPYRGSDDCNELIFRPNHLTLSTTKGAKGYDAPVVFLIGCDQIPNTKEGRASFYVGATRAKLILHVSGLEQPPSLLEECVAVLRRLRATGRDGSPAAS